MEFDNNDCMKSSDKRQRVVDVAGELFKFTLILRPLIEVLIDRHSEREERLKNGRLLSQAEKLQEQNPKVYCNEHSSLP